MAFIWPPIGFMYMLTAPAQLSLNSRVTLSTALLGCLLGISLKRLSTSADLYLVVWASTISQSFSSYPVSHIQSTLKSSWLCLQNPEDADGSHHLPGFHSCPCVVLHSPPSWFLLLPLALSVFCRPSHRSDPCDGSVRPCHCAVRLLW